MQVILLERIEKLGQMGDVVSVKPGYARNYLLPQRKALRATKENVERYEREHTEFEASNLEHRGEAEAVAAKLEGLTCVLLRQASESAQLYGSVTARDIAQAVAEGGATIHHAQVRLDRPIKTLGIHRVRIALHPEVIVGVDVNVARSAEEAQAQAAAAARAEAASEAAASADEGKIGPAREKGEPAAEPAARGETANEAGEDEATAETGEKSKAAPTTHD